MAELNFPKSGLLFDEEEHRYYYQGEVLTSVTTLLKQTLFANKYHDVDKATLENAARFGTTIHRLLEIDGTITDTMLVDTFNDVYNGVEFDDYDKNMLLALMCGVYGKAKMLLCGVKNLAHEYLVTDGRIAGSVDLIAMVNGEPAIVDYKFTYNADIEYLSWQESIYAYLFYKMTGQRISKAYALWIPKRDASLGWFNPIPMKRDEEIEALINGELVNREDAFPVAVKEAQMALANIIIQEKAIAEQKKQLQATLLEFMEANAVKTIKSDYYTISYVAPSVRKSFDAKAFSAAHPEINLDDYQKSTNVKSSVKITTK